MLSIETILTFFAASALLAIAPGPDNIFVLTQSALKGKRAGMMVVLGLCTGLIGHSTAVAFGVAVIFQTSAFAFTALKVVGAGYLVYLAWQVFRAAPSEIHLNSNDHVRTWQLYGRGIIMNITNPKVSIFFLSFLPQFADPTRGPLWIQLLMLGGLFIIATIVVFGSIAMLAGMLGQQLNRSAMAQRVLNGIAGTVFLALALKFITAQR